MASKRSLVCIANHSVCFYMRLRVDVMSKVRGMKYSYYMLFEHSLKELFINSTDTNWLNFKQKATIESLKCAMRHVRRIKALLMSIIYIVLDQQITNNHHHLSELLRLQSKVSFFPFSHPPLKLRQCSSFDMMIICMNKLRCLTSIGADM